MISNEELLSNDHFAFLNGDQQSDLLRKHCSVVEERIRTAPSRYDAERVAASTCIQFQQDCSSAMLRNALIHRVEDLLTIHWGMKPV